MLVPMAINIALASNGNPAVYALIEENDQVFKHHLNRYKYAERYPEFAKDMQAWLAARQIHYREDLVEGLENAPQAFIGLLQGHNFGKLVIRVGADD